MSTCVVERRRHTSGHSREVSSTEGFWDIVGTVSTGPSFVELKPVCKQHGSFRDADYIRGYFRKAKLKLNLHGTKR